MPYHSRQFVPEGYLVPALTILLEKLQARHAVMHTCASLMDALIAGFAHRFQATMCDVETIVAASLSPKFRKHWTDDASVLDKGKLVVCE